MPEPLDLLIRKLARHSTLTNVEKSTLQDLPIMLKTVRPDQAVVRQGDSPSEACLLLRGLVASYTMTSQGVRQFTSFFVPGDMPDLRSLHLPTSDTSLCTMSTCVLGFIPHAALHAAMDRHPGLARAFWRETLVQATVLQVWVANLGGRSSLARLTHLFCELRERLRAVGLGQASGYDLPLSQTELGEAAGLSTVHVNRVLRELREQGLVQVQRGRVDILDWERLCAMGDFDPAYLHLAPAPAKPPRLDGGGRPATAP